MGDSCFMTVAGDFLIVARPLPPKPDWRGKRPTFRWALYQKAGVPLIMLQQLIFKKNTSAC